MKEYIYLICPFTALIICQIIKFGIESIKNKKMNFARLFNGCGGMPSSHTTFSSSITMLIGYTLGFNSPIFATALIFTFIVSYDAMGLRFESGKQAEAINYIFEQFIKGNRKQSYTKLKEQLGHKPLEVLVGMFLGSLISFIYYIILF